MRAANKRFELLEDQVGDLANRVREMIQAIENIRALVEARTAGLGGNG